MQWRGIMLAAAVLAAPAQVAAQNPYSPALTVNNSAITHYDIAQRIRLLEALGARGEVDELAVEQLTEDRLRIQAAEALGIELPEGAVVAGIEEFAAARGLSFDDVISTLAARDIDRQTMDDFVIAGLLWREVLQNRFRARAVPSEEELDAALTDARDAPVEVVQMREIALPFEERGEAETTALAERLRRELAQGASFAELARNYSRSGTAARGGLLDPVPATRLPSAIRAQILLLEPGGVAGPVPISGGLALLRLDSIRQVPRGTAEAAVPDEELRNQLREELFSQRIASFGQGYLQELLRDALIVER